MKRPAFQFYPSDWRKDAALQSCSLAAQGLWINLLCIAHECHPYGHLTVNGRAMSVAQMGRLVGLSSKECERLLQELADAGVSSVSEEGALFSRRMVRDEDVRNRRANGGQAGAEYGIRGGEHGSKGGRPKQERGVMKPPLEPPPSSSSSTSVGQISEAIASSSAEPTASGANGHKVRLPPCPHEQIVAMYHETLPELPGIRVLDDQRRKLIRDLWAFALTTRTPEGVPRATGAASAVEWIRDFFDRARNNDFVMGRSPRGAGHENWRASLDYLCSNKGIKRVVEQTEVVAA